MTRLLLVLALFAPFAASAQDTATGTRTGADLINDELGKTWSDAGIKPPSACSDLEFLRRVTLDLTGTVPSLERLRAFMADTSASKREKLVDELLASGRFVDNWTMLWQDLLMSMSVERSREQGAGEAFRIALRERIAKNQPFDAFVRELLTTTASWSNDAETQKESHEGLVMWYSQFNQNRANVMSSSVSKVFLGVQIQCAECHDHPFDKWTQEDFKANAAWFGRFRPERKQIGEKVDKQRDQKYLYSIQDENPAANRNDKKPAKAVPDKARGNVNTADPRFLDGAAIPDGVARRINYAQWLTSKSNRQFAKNAVNRMWAHFFGRGIVHPFDDFTLRNKPVVPALLDRLADDFTAGGYDLRKLMRAMVLSKAYQMTSAAKESDPGAVKYFARTQVRSLTPEQLFNAVVDATTPGGADYGTGAEVRGGNKGGRGGGGRREFLTTFRGARNEADAAAEPEIGVPQALYLMNGALMAAAAKAMPQSQLAEILAKRKIPGERIEDIYLSLLCRKPNGGELAKAAQYIANHKKTETVVEQPAKGNGRPQKPMGGKAADPDAQAYEDLVWALLNSTEFQTNH